MPQTPSETVSSKTVQNFNHEIRRLAEMLKSEFPVNMTVRSTYTKLTTALKFNMTLPYNLFVLHVSSRYGDRLKQLDKTLIEEIKKEHSKDPEAENLLPAVALIWNQGGAKTKDPIKLQDKIMLHLSNLCKFDERPQATRTSTAEAGGKVPTAKSTLKRSATHVEVLTRPTKVAKKVNPVSS